MGKRGRPPHPDILTPREWQVLDLIREGLTNEQIALRLDISPATAKYHVSEIISKLGVQTREEAAAWQPEGAVIRWWQRAFAGVPRRTWPLAGAAGALAAIAGLAVLLVALTRDSEGEPPPAVAETSSPKPTAPSTASPRPISAAWNGNPRASRELAFLDAQSRLWQGAADGSQRRLLVTQTCPDGKWFIQYTLTWSPTGDLLAWLCTDEYENAELHLHGGPEGVIVAAVNANHFLWSPDGRVIAYQSLNSQRSAPPVAQVVLLSAPDLQPVRVIEDAVLLAWPLPTRLLLGLHPVPDEGLFAFRDSEANWFDLETGAGERVARLDNTQFWVAPDGRKAIVLARLPGSEKPSDYLAIYDLVTGEERVLEGAPIAFYTEAIPQWKVQISPDSSEFYWANSGYPAEAEVVYRAPMDGSAIEELAVLPGYSNGFSGDGLVLYTPARSDVTMPVDVRGAFFVRDLHTGAETEISDQRIGSWAPPAP